jgi:outer membrane protein assembly factor BamE (lipoprotein component of BamABCDE complex)
MKMTKSTLFLAAAALGAAFAVTGCDTFAHRAKERSATYEQLDTGTQQRLKRGELSPGDNNDMVYIALGRPDERRVVTTPDGQQEVWIYKTYWQQYEGSAWVGWRRVIVPTGRGGYYIYHEPVRSDIYSEHAADTTRVTMNRGVVQSVEQSDRR